VLLGMTGGGVACSSEWQEGELRVPRNGRDIAILPEKIEKKKLYTQKSQQRNTLRCDDRGNSVSVFAALCHCESRLRLVAIFIQNVCSNHANLDCNFQPKHFFLHETSFLSDFLFLRLNVYYWLFQNIRAYEHYIFL